uniref:Putative secreted protein n=1 Tax=Ixodes ricinus TaxID=34613 RepID=A0A147BET5_IXORI
MEAFRCTAWRPSRCSGRDSAAPVALCAAAAPCRGFRCCLPQSRGRGGGGSSGETSRAARLDLGSGLGPRAWCWACRGGTGGSKNVGLSQSELRPEEVLPCGESCGPHMTESGGLSKGKSSPLIEMYGALMSNSSSWRSVVPSGRRSSPAKRSTGLSRLGTSESRLSEQLPLPRPSQSDAGGVPHESGDDKGSLSSR